MIDPVDIRVPTPDRSYEIVFHENLEKQLQALNLLFKHRKFMIVTDENVAEKTRIFSLINNIDRVPMVTLKPGEAEKTWSSIDKILKTAFETGMDRDSVMVGVGGGVVGDMTGFAASIFMRGIPFFQVPTTLLAMVDASIGGKTGIDCEYGKNLIGTITQPEAILVCPEFLTTLPDIEIRNGIAEMVKHGIIGSPAHFQALETLSLEDFSVIRENIFDHVLDSIEVKKAIVEQDETEQGVRGFLNLGHTFGHAIELKSNFQIPHGRAVAIGCVMATQFAAKKDYCDSSLVDQIKRIFVQFGVDLSCDIPPDQIWEAMAHDKKKKGGMVRLILPKKIGKVDYYEVSQL